MADPVTTPTDQTNPLDAGHTTTEANGSKLVVIIAGVIGVLGTLTTVIDSISNIIPAAQKGIGLWLAVASIVVAALTQIAYTVMRSQIKIAAIKAGRVPPSDPAVPAADPTAAAKNLGA